MAVVRMKIFIVGLLFKTVLLMKGLRYATILFHGASFGCIPRM